MASGCFIYSNTNRKLPRHCDATFINCGGCQLLTDIDAKIQATMDSDLLQELLLRRQDALTKANEWHDPLTRYLPVELVAKIFRYCLPPTLHPSYFNDREPYRTWWMRDHLEHMLRVFASLCKTWRSTALSTPNLWQTLHVERHPDLPYAERYLQRSGGLPLFLDIQMNNDTWSSEVSEGFLKLISKHVARWRLVRLKAPASVISSISAHTSTIKEGAPQLAFLMLYDITSRSTRGCLLSVGDPNDAPRPVPVFITLEGVRISKITFDYHKLTSLKLDSTTIGNFVDILRLSPLLTSVEINVIPHIPSEHEADKEPKAPTEVFFHSGVTSFKAKIHDTEEESLFDSFNFPSLKTLHCIAIDIDPDSEYEYDELFRFILHSKCPLTTLHLHLSCSEEELIALLRLTPDLYHLAIDKCTLTPNFFRYLGETARNETSSSSGTGFLLQLRSFEFHADQIFPGHDHFEYKLFRWMIPAPPVETYRPFFSKLILYLGEQYGMWPDEVSDLVRLIDSDVEISILHANGDFIRFRGAIHAAHCRLWERQRAARANERSTKSQGSDTNQPRVEGPELGSSRTLKEI